MWNLLWFLVIIPLVVFSQKRNFWLPKPIPWWFILFFFSGFPALLYQIVWQRALFAIYGVNTESVTIVVTAFMLGLGLGSLLGGVISKKNRLPQLAIFGIVELLIAAWGFVSLSVFHWAARFTAGAPPLQTGLLSFALVVVPTVLMGATLPVLVAHTVRISGNVGASVGALYAVNTLGSAAACFCSGLFIMRKFGESGSVLLAAGINAAIGTLVLVWYLRAHRHGSAKQARLRESLPESSDAMGGPETRIPDALSAERMEFSLALVIVGTAGFISLAYELIWYRLFSFSSGGLAKSFAFLLGAYLAGIGIGSLVSEPVCKRLPGRKTYLRSVAVFVFAANILGFLVAPLLCNLVRHVSFYWTLLPIGGAAAFLGAVFPLICDVAVRADNHAGARMSYLYLSNIVGSALGSYLVGFVLMDLLSLKHIAMSLAILGVALGVALIFSGAFEPRQRVVALAGALGMTIFILASSDALFAAMYEKMLMKTDYRPSAGFVHVVENKSGVITVTRGGMVLGGGIYDGHFNVNLVRDTNGIERAYALSYFHPNPKEVLMVGLASGSWAQIIANHPQVQHLTIVEINPGYLQLIPLYPEVASMLHNPKVQIIVDDGRRWLFRNPNAKFDVIVMNTTHHWRSHATNLLSRDFLKEIRHHLNPGGVDFYNTTSSAEVQATGVEVFPYGLRIANCLVVSDSPLQLDRDRWREVLSRYTIDGKPVLNLFVEADRARLNEVLSMADTLDRPTSQFFALESASHIRLRSTNARLITDDNMGTEWQQ